MAKKSEDTSKPDAKLEPAAAAQPEPVPVTIVPPTPPAPPAAAEPAVEDPAKKTPEGQINVPPPPPEDPRLPRLPSDAVPVGKEHLTPAAQQRAAEKLYAGEDPNEPDDEPSSKKGKK